MLEGLPTRKQTSRILADTACQSLISNPQLPITNYSTFPVNVAIFNSPIAFVI